MSKPAALSISLILLVTSSSGMGSSPQSDAIVASFGSGSTSKATTMLNEIKRATLDRDALELLLELWTTGGTEHGETVASMMRRDIVRINVADVLIQAHRNDLVVAPVSEIRAYALDSLSSHHPDSVSQALFVLSTVDNSMDTQSTAKIAVKSTSTLVFRSAILSLVYMCNAEADLKLDEIRPKLDETGQAFVDRNRERKHANWCVDPPISSES